MNKKQQKVQELATKHTSSWIDEARERQANKKWLDYSAEIAMRVLDAIDEIPGMTQKKLAEKMGVTPQQVSKIVKGEQNLTLETIVKLQEALGIKLLSLESYNDSRESQGINEQKSHRTIVAAYQDIFDVIISSHNHKEHIYGTIQLQPEQPMTYSQSEVFYCEN